MVGTTQNGSTISVLPRPGDFGAAVAGLDLSRRLEPAALAAVNQALADHGVIWLADQPLTHAELEAFSGQFGAFGANPFVEPLADHPHIVEARRDPAETVAVFGGGWHSDWSFLAEPPAVTILHAKVTPPSGGDTLFADTAGAWDELSVGFRRSIGGLRALHTAAGPYGAEGYFAKETGRTGMRIRSGADADRTHAHPIAPVHPVSRRRALFINPGYAVGIEGWTKAESDAVLAFLFNHMTSDAFVYRHVWQPDMLVMWDNRSVLHHALGGYDGHLRLLHRTVIAGGRPL
jgi:taurine dioxygenase